ncbi:MAG: hypothetical protein KAS23_02780, partial [Anaerohalosphaera sp.]|nr:hypothetical protein [Anaerohalosphaera sp.]
MAHKHIGIKKQEFSQGDGQACACQHGHDHDHRSSTQFGVSLALLGTLAGGVLIINSLIAPIFYGEDCTVGQLCAMVGAILLGAPVVWHALKCMLHGHMHMDELV